jgi:CSLREA domain-containing protein
VVTDLRIPLLAQQCGVVRVLCTAFTLCLATTAYSAVPSLKVVNDANQQLQLGASYDLGYSLSKSIGAAEALSLAHGDFNTDGFQDLVSGYATDTGGMVTLHRGNEQAYAPSTAASLASVKQGIFPQGFVAQSSLYSVPVAPEFMETGDFNRDGDVDLVVAKRGDAALYFLPGSRGGFGVAQKIALEGGVNAIAAGQIDMPDGMADLAVAIANASGASLLVYNELAGIHGKARSYKLPASADALEVGNLDDSAMGDIAMLAAGKVLVLHGHDQGAQVTNVNRLETLSFDFPVQAFALGNFVWDRANNTEIAILKADGSVQFAARGALNTNAFSVAEARALRRQQAAVKSVTLKSWQQGQGGTWNIVESTEAQLSKGIAVRGAKLFSARLSGKASDDLVIVDVLTRSLQILSKSGDTRSVNKVAATNAPVAAIAMQTSSFGLNSLISLGEGARAATVLPSAARATFTVSKTADTNDGTCNADCSLREAIGAANAAAGADSIVLPAGTYQLTIANLGGLNEDNNAQGDLDVNDALTITGAGSATTIIRAGTTTSNGIDKVFAFNPICVSPMATAISGVTVSFGRNTQPTSAPDFSYTGGGMDWCGTGNSTMTVTNSIFDSNTNTLGYGGGINLDSFAANGSVTITGTTISTNRTLSTLGNNTGGGVNLFGDQHGVTITNSNITGNTAAGEGAGLFVRHTNGGAILVQGTNLSSNIASSRGGGISNVNLGASTFTINQDSTVASNISQGLAGLAAEGGGIYSSANATTTINEVTITGNAANGAGAPEQRGGGGIATGVGTVNVTFNRITGNTALGLGGSGIRKDLNPGTTTATNNWWGCNAGAANAPCDRAVSAGGAGVTLTSTPHLVLNHVASPSTIVVGQTSALTADFLTNSASTAIAVANLDAIIGTTHAHTSPVLGTHSATQTAIQAAGNATATFTATAAGAGSSSSVVDSQTQTVAITISKANTTTTITSDTPDPSIAGNAVTVAYSVSPVAPGAGTPTGNVTVTVSGGAETCTGTVAAGSCSITLNVGGARTLTATYAGDSNFNSSNDTEPHTVTVCPATVVTNGNDSGAGSLRQIITDACPASTVTFQAGVSTVTLTSAELAINKNLTIDGGTSLVTVTRSTAGGTPNFRIFNVQSGNTVSMNALTVSNGNHPSQAGGIQNSGSLTLTNMNITGNRSPQSAGLQNDSVLNLSNSSVTNNIASSFGGGLGVAGAGTTTLANCTFTGNQAQSDTGAIGAGGSSLSITNCTISGNTLVNALGVGAGITTNGVPTTLRNTIVLGNTEGGGSQSNIDGAVQAASAFNVVGTGPAGGLTNGTNNNQVGVATALLGSLANYGGLTPTLPLLPGSVAINAGSSTGAPANDQRGIARVGTVDVGAFESRGFTLAISGGNSQSAVIGAAFTNPLSVTVSPAGVGEPVQGGRVTYTPPGAGASASLVTNPAIINALGVASVTATANSTSGSYSVSANANGNNGSALSFNLQNLAPGLSINDVTVNEGNAGITNYTFTVSLSAPAGAGGVSFDIATANNTALAGVDYVANTLTAQTILAGSSTRTFTVQVNGDTLNEATETFFVNVTNVTGATVVDAQSVGFITNDDALPSLSINDVSVTEGNSGTTNAVFTVTLNAASGQTVQVNYATANDTATQPADYTSTSGTLSFTSGQTTQTITVPVVGDVLSESNETYFVNLSGATNSTISDNQGVGTIVDDELPNLTINDVSITEGGSGAQVLTFTVTRTGTTASASGFSFATADGTATAADSDYVAASGTGTIPAGGATASTTVSVTTNGDAVFENNETLLVNLSAPTNAVITDNQGVGTITNDDASPTLAINDVSIVEGNSGTQNLVFTVTRTGLTALPASFIAATADGTATAPSDYLAALAGSTTIAAGGATGTTTLIATINGDAVVEANETFVINLTAPGNATISDNQGQGTITNDDTAGIVLTQSAGSTDVTEGGATDSYTLVLTSQPTNNVSIALNPGTQVTVATSPVVFTTMNWNTPQTVTVTAVDDAAVEGPHTGTISHTVTSSDAVYNNFTVANVTANITDNDLPTLSINDVSITEGNSGTQVLNFTVTRTGTTPSAVGFNFTTADGTATTVDSDYVAASGTGTIPSGGATASTTVSVTINGDAIFENNESFLINLSAPTNAVISDAQGTGTITNDETAPTLAINDVSIVEGNSGTQNLVFTVTRTGLTALPASFTATTADGTATAPSDYLAALVGSTSIAAGGATGTTTLSATINGDSTFEPNESFFVNLTVPVNATIADNQGIGTITNDDGAPTYTPGPAITRQQGSSASFASLGIVSDLTDPASALTVAFVPGGTATGVSTSNLLNSNGNVSADIAASCTAASGTLRLTVTDLNSLTDTDDFQVNITPNTPPTLSYAAINIGVGASITQNPATGLNDNGGLPTVSITSQGTYTGGISISSTGVISLNNATPAGNHTITVRATDNCNANTDVSFQITVNQASTIKQLTSNVNPARFAESINLSVQVAGIDPTGSVEFFNGTTSLGTAPLTTSPSGGNNLKLANLSVSNLSIGNQSLTARYSGDVNNAASTSPVLTQTVIAADTRISVSPAANPASAGSSVISVSVSAIAPGGGVPQGSVTLSAGVGNSCTAALTAGVGSCTLSFATAGFNAITASYTPSNTNHNASTGGGALVVLSAPSSTDLRVRIGNGVRNISAGQVLRYDIVVDNIGTQAAVGRLQVPLSADYTSASYSCVSAALATCAASGNGSIDQELSLAPGGVVIYSLTVTAPITPERTITQNASITVKTPTTDSDLSNDSASDVDPMGLLADGFENGSVNE